MSRRLSWSLFLLLSFFSRSIIGACYFRNGTQQSSDYSPCSSDPSDALHLVCCAKWDTCLPIGLCQSTYDKKLYREGCAKQNWNEGGCQELCSNEREAQRNDNVLVTPCSGNTTSAEWCCGTSADCCSAGSDLPRYTLARKFGDPIPTPRPSSSSILPSSMASSTSITSPTASDSSSPSRTGLSPGAKAGIGVGVAGGVIVLIALGVFIRKAMQWRKSAKAAEAAPAFELPEKNAPVEVYQYQGDFKAAQLAGMESTIHELPHSPHTPELGSTPKP